MPSIEEKKAAYQKHKNLKLAAAELGMSFQTLYWQLRKEGVPITGDKERYGSVKDRFGCHAERIFSEIVDWAEDQNNIKHQAKFDFLVGDIRVDVKAAKRQSLGIGAGGDRWAFSIKRQKTDCDFFALFGFSKDAELESIFLIPAELIVGFYSVSISVNGKSKWHPYAVTKDELRQMFYDMTR